MTQFTPAKGAFGEFGGMFVPEILVPALEQLDAAFEKSRQDAEFLSRVSRFAAQITLVAPRPCIAAVIWARGQKPRFISNVRICCTAAQHKTNQVIGQALLAKKMGKSRLIAETGAGQHGVATAIVGALFGLTTRIYMGTKDIERQSMNVFRMRLMGAEVVPVTAGSQSLKDAVNEALRDWSASYDSTHYLLGTAAGPHPFPTMVREFQRIIGTEAKQQIVKQAGRLPDAVIACVGGGSNAIGMFADLVPESSVRLIGVEAAGHGHAHAGSRCDFAARSTRNFARCTNARVTRCSWSNSGIAFRFGRTGLSWSRSGTRPSYGDRTRGVRRHQLTKKLSPHFAYWLEVRASSPRSNLLTPSHYATKHAAQAANETILLVNLSGRGDKDILM